ncbi:MAG: polyphosphate kinase 1, partial [Bacillota bacterium]|nr:polyphosphate kinase 1 [Bacillota bacterium]
MKDLKFDSSNFINRELSWLEFNRRVLEEAQDTNNPLFERLKFLSIVSSNLDEFFMVRVGSLTDQIDADFNKADPAGLTPKHQISKIGETAHKLVYDQYNCYTRSLIPALKKEKIYLLKDNTLDQNQEEYIQDYFSKTIYPVLTPMVVDQSRPFPLILNKSLNIAILLENKENKGKSVFATVQVPSVLSRLVNIPSKDDENSFVLLEQIIKKYIEQLFVGHNVLSMSCYRITRNADLGFDEEGAEDLLHTIEVSIKQRKWGACIRLEIEQDMNDELLQKLKEELEVPNDGIYQIAGPVDLSFAGKIGSLDGFEELKYEKIYPQKSLAFMDEENIFKAISKQDILIHLPFESFDPVIELVKRASVDPYVLAIKQTLYRVSGNSPIIAALIQAAENGKQVTVLVELKARFDEQNNIQWAKRLEKSGCHVIYGLVGLKTHCKVLLVVRKEEDGIKRYVHMATGNYNDVTAKFYTDLGLFTANPYFGADASALFNMLSGYSQITKMYKVFIAPITMRDEFMHLIDKEIEHAKKGKKARIIAKVNSLVDEGIIKQLYAASNAGVEIDLIVRGICCLRPQVKGISENIRVISIVGRFLEHSRIYYF